MMKWRQKKPMNPTFFDLIIHGEGIVRPHVRRNQDLSGVLQHLRQRETHVDVFLILFSTIISDVKRDAVTVK